MSNDEHNLGGCWVIVFIGFIGSLVAIPLNTLQLIDHLFQDEITQNADDEGAKSGLEDFTNKPEIVTSEDLVLKQIEDAFENDTPVLRQPVIPPENYSCPRVTGAGWLQYPRYWYGPYYDRHGQVSYISYDQLNIYVSNSLLGMSNYRDPASFGGRSEWWPLKTAPFSICVDHQGHLFVIFSG